MSVENPNPKDLPKSTFTQNLLAFARQAITGDLIVNNTIFNRLFSLSSDPNTFLRQIYDFVPEHYPRVNSWGKISTTVLDNDSFLIISKLKNSRLAGTGQCLDITSIEFSDSTDDWVRVETWTTPEGNRANIRVRSLSSQSLRKFAKPPGLSTNWQEVLTESAPVLDHSLHSPE